MSAMTFRRAQMLALLHARAIGAHPPLSAAATGHRGAGWFVVEIGSPQWVTAHDPATADPDLPVLVVEDSGHVIAYQTPSGPRFHNLREVEGEVVDLDTAMREA